MDLLKFAPCKYVANFEIKKPGSKYGEKMVNAPFAYHKLKQGVYHLPVTKQMRYLPSLPQIYSSVFTNLRHICE